MSSPAPSLQGTIKQVTSQKNREVLERSLRSLLNNEYLGVRMKDALTKLKRPPRWTRRQWYSFLMGLRANTSKLGENVNVAELIKPLLPSETSTALARMQTSALSVQKNEQLRKLTDKVWSAPGDLKLVDRPLNWSVERWESFKNIVKDREPFDVHAKDAEIIVADHDNWKDPIASDTKNGDKSSNNRKEKKKKARTTHVDESNSTTTALEDLRREMVEQAEKRERFEKEVFEKRKELEEKIETMSSELETRRKEDDTRKCFDIYRFVYEASLRLDEGEFMRGISNTREIKALLNCIRNHASHMSSTGSGNVRMKMSERMRLLFMKTVDSPSTELRKAIDEGKFEDALNLLPPSGGGAEGMVSVDPSNLLDADRTATQISTNTPTFFDDTTSCINSEDIDYVILDPRDQYEWKDVIREKRAVHLKDGSCFDVRFILNWIDTKIEEGKIPRNTYNRSKLKREDYTAITKQLMEHMRYLKETQGRENASIKVNPLTQTLLRNFVLGNDPDLSLIIGDDGDDSNDSVFVNALLAKTIGG